MTEIYSYAYSIYFIPSLATFDDPAQLTHDDDGKSQRQLKSKKCLRVRECVQVCGSRALKTFAAWKSTE